MSRRNEWIPAYAFDTGGSLSLSNEKKGSTSVAASGVCVSWEKEKGKK